MKSPIISKDKNSGFTLVEILVVLAIVGVIFLAGAFVDLNSLHREILTTEQTILVSLLESARNRAMNNLEHSKHGIHIDEDFFVLFVGSDYTPEDNLNEKTKRNKNISITTVPENINEVIFDQISGDPNILVDFYLNDGIRTKSIKVKEGGLIDW